MAFPTQRGKLALAAYLEQHSDFRLTAANLSLSQALQQLETHPEDYGQQFIQANKLFKRCVFVLLMLCALFGALAVPSALLGDHSQQVNIFWLLLVLLGVHLLNLVMWGVSLLISPLRASAPHSYFLATLVFLNNKLAPLFKLNPKVCAAYLQWQCHPYSNKWLLSLLSHCAWGVYLSAGLFMSVLLLLTNQVTFVWETTLLNEQTFISLTGHLSWLPSQLGIALPNQFDILNSPVDTLSQTDLTRQRWANFLLISLALYGVLPRLVCGIISLLMYRLKRFYLPLSPYEKSLQQRYQVPLKDSKIVDKEALQPSPATPPMLATLQDLPNAALRESWALYEWLGAPPAILAAAKSLCYLHDRQTQQSFLAQPNSSPMYLLVTPTQSPDRGTLRLLNEAKQAYPRLSLVLEHCTCASSLEDWQRFAAQSHLPLYKMTQEG